MANNPSSGIKTESIDEVILRLLGLNPGTEIDYQTYFKILRNKLAMARMGGRELPEEEDILLRDELKRVKVIKEKGIRFKVTTKKTRVQAKAEPKPKVKKNQAKLGPKGEIVKYKGGLVPFDKIKPVDVQDVTEKKGEDKFTEIRKTLNSILSILSSKFKFDQKQSDKDRRDKESERRGKRESTLEGFKKGISEIVGITKKVLSPFKSIIDRIWKFIFYTLLGRAFTSFMNWLSDKENQKKFDALIKFLTEHWPALVGIYVLFGTSFGKLVRGLIKAIVRTTVALAVNIPRIFTFIKKNKKLSLLGLGAATFASGYISREVGNIFSTEAPDSDKGLKPTDTSELDQAKKTADQAKNTKVPQFNLGGMVPKMPTFNFGGMIPQIPNLASFAMGGLNPMSLQSGIPISGAGKDDTLIAAKTGEAILTEKDQSDLSQRYVDRKTGQPLNIPQYLSGRKPGFVNMSNLRFNGGGYFDGGRIQKFESGGVVGGNFSSISPKIGFNPMNSMDFDFNQKMTAGIAKPLALQGGGIIENTKNFLGNLFNFGRTKPTTPTKPKVLQDYQSPEAQALLRTIRAAEHYKGSNPYQSIYGGGNIPTLTKMTVKEVIDMGNTGKLPIRFGGGSAGYGSGSSATGAYQFMPFTLQDLVRRGAVKLNQIMTPDLQDRLGWELAKNRGVNLGSLKKTGLNQSIMDMMAPEWASFPYSPSGGKSYHGQPVKGADFLRKIYLESLRENNLQKRLGGGLVTKDSGYTIPGANRDTQLFKVQSKKPEFAALEKGEYVVSKGTVSGMGGEAVFDTFESIFNKNSNAARLGKSTVKMREISPYNSSFGGMITLPPIVQSMSGNRARVSGYAGGSKVPKFSVTAPNNHRYENALIYGLIETTV